MLTAAVVDVASGALWGGSESAHVTEMDSVVEGTAGTLGIKGTRIKILRNSLGVEVVLSGKLAAQNFHSTSEGIKDGLRSLFEALLIATYENINAPMVGVDSVIAGVIELQHETQRFVAKGTREVTSWRDLVGNQPDGLATKLRRIPDCPVVFRGYQKPKFHRCISHNVYEILWVKWGDYLVVEGILFDFLLFLSKKTTWFNWSGWIL